MKILITGGNGFIGRHVIELLVNRGIDVVSMDIVLPRSPNPNVQYITGTVLDEFLLRRMMKGCSQVIHMAALMGVKRTDRDPLLCNNVNIIGTQRVLEAAVYAGVDRVFYSSSSEVLGDLKQDMNERAQPAPKSVYGIAKLAAEEYVKAYRAKHGLSYTLVRFFNVYGVGQVADFVLPKFVRLAQNGQNLQVYGDGSQVRSFCYVSDAARAVVDLALRDDAVDELFHVGNGTDPVTMIDLARLVVEAAKTKSKVKLVDFTKSDRTAEREVHWRMPDVSKLSQLTGYVPQVSLQDGIKNMLEANDNPDQWAQSQIPQAGALF